MENGLHSLTHTLSLSSTHTHTQRHPYTLHPCCWQAKQDVHTSTTHTFLLFVKRGNLVKCLCTFCCLLKHTNGAIWRPVRCVLEASMLVVKRFCKCLCLQLLFFNAALWASRISVFLSQRTPLKKYH